MKELSIEEKAKHYDEAIERAKNFIENGDESERTIAESIFAGLMEVSEDEKIRKWIRKELESKYVVDNIVNNVMADKALAWLEKEANGNEREIPNSAWSEEDETRLNRICGLLEGLPLNQNWLKSLKERYTWKPSDLQLECLSDAIKHYNSQGYDAPILKELLNKLSKLKG